ncbi:hypothetical protein [Parapedobacter soli]|uniref:hypothetical protein n=1 Tax=Parapedobacter soli TaxID=416955 RepID=UPI0021CA3A1E|nr:hypothetical protein [Parapedobacter soli]
MFKQITDLSGNEWYLIASLWIFLLFFIIVGIRLFRMRKADIDYMKGIPMDDEATSDDEPVN